MRSTRKDAAALQRGNAAEARQVVANLDTLASQLRQEYRLRSPGGPKTRPASSASIRASRAAPISSSSMRSIRAAFRCGFPSATTRRTRRRPCRALRVRVPIATFNAVRNDKTANGIVQNAELAEKRRGYLEPEFKMAVLPGRITRW